jgi:hypothetical protein
MPKTPINYSKSCIYKICCKDTNITDCYIGSTTNFRSRKWSHKSKCNNETNKPSKIKVYQFIRDNGGWDNWDMVLVEKVNVNDSYELHKQERKYIEELNSTLNYEIPTRTRKEWEEENKEKIIQYRIDNKDKNSEYQKIYYEEKIKNKGIEKVECPNCNCLIKRHSLSKHKKTKKCMNAK